MLWFGLACWPFCPCIWYTLLTRVPLSCHVGHVNYEWYKPEMVGGHGFFLVAKQSQVQALALLAGLNSTSTPIRKVYLSAVANWISEKLAQDVLSMAHGTAQPPLVLVHFGDTLKYAKKASMLGLFLSQLEYSPIQRYLLPPLPLKKCYIKSRCTRSTLA